MPEEDLALSIALGIVFGIFPAPVCPTALCALAALALRLNPSPIQAVNCLVSPLQVILFAPMARLGTWLFHTAPAAMFPVPAYIAHTIAWRMAARAVQVSGSAAAAWLCLCVPCGLLTYAAVVCCKRRARQEAV
ncbi:MAG TPA: DUF2062 domain-containing protein [Bryobacteraceae bacterium]|nr:DUF2062 domain-containing protein [Bryobacteraceae bacterium]